MTVQESSVNVNMTDAMRSVCAQIGQARIVPILTLKSADSAILIAEALAASGIKALEVTFRTSAAAQSIQLIRRHLPEMLVGAGTILTIEQFEIATDAGSQFILSPGLNPEIVETSLKSDALILPGVNTPTDIDRAMGLGLAAVKFFPAEVSGGTAFLNAIASPYPMMKFMPTGGIDQANLSSYLELPNVLACAGTWILPSKLVERSDYESIAQIATNAVMSVAA